MQDDEVDYGKVWNQIIIGDDKGLVCFSSGTCVVFVDKPTDIKQSAITLMREWGPVHAGSSAGDFTVIHLEDRGWVVTSHHNDILTYVDPSEGEFDSENDIRIGLYGRSKRNADSEELKIVFVRNGSYDQNTEKV